MAESMKGWKRSHRCGELSTGNVGEEVTVMGWVQKQRNKGGIIFVDLRDRSGILQIIFEEKDCGTEAFAKAGYKVFIQTPQTKDFNEDLLTFREMSARSRDGPERAEAEELEAVYP